MRGATSTVCAVGLAVALAGGATPEGAAAATASFWSAGQHGTACRQGRVEMIVGGDASADGCIASRDAAPPARIATATPLRIDASTQRIRDDDRRAILQQELDRERQALARLQAGPAAGDTADALARTRDNVAALQREIARTP